MNSSTELLEQIKISAENVKAEELIIINIKKHSSFADYLVVCHGNSSVHVKGISEQIYLNLKQKGILPLGVEGKEESEWILMDYGEIVVHVFQEQIRSLYKIESLYDLTEIPLEK